MKVDLSLLFFSLTTSLAQAAIHVVKVNGGEQVTFIPSQISAAVGDTLEFHILGEIPELLESPNQPECHSRFDVAVTEGFESTLSSVTTSLILRICDTLYTLLSVIRRRTSILCARDDYFSGEIFTDFPLELSKRHSGSSLQKLAAGIPDEAVSGQRQHGVKKRCYGIIYGCVWERETGVVKDNKKLAERDRFRNLTKRSRFHAISKKRDGHLYVSVPIVDNEPFWVSNPQGEQCSEGSVLGINTGYQ